MGPVAIRRAGASVLAGALAGVLVLGGGGRLAMAALALARGARPAFSVGGTLEVLLVGAFYGAIGGLIRLPLAAAAPRRAPGLRGALTGVLVFATAAVTSGAARGPLQGLSPPLVTAVLAAAALVCIGYGVVLESWMSTPREDR